ncbi:alcohol dehydrogenase catalytic domain-containing protein [Mesorhizobium sp. STM 4661]|uniref:alcohol dehydrogenase catalytic domain-containing protein n=1 Tax=Mesorhizobium sp. STM 4661 TaxID=1297570 RepID=UPI0002C03465|nr:alcohol dehydrogenase catalytic domain-containing protein [Mesorhizobium sp. STM 4661]CCV15552.1 putative NADPH:quinone reductase [Mesorhizobium sp. STM 4661]
MTSGAAALCLGPGGSGGFTVRQFTRRRPAADELEVAVTAASVNPIDVRRSEGYGRRLLSLLGAGRFPLILGNDLAGIVTAVGSRVSTFKTGDRVYGVKPASAEGAHASHVLVKAVHMLAAPGDWDLHALAAIPYSFTTMWLAVRGAGLSRENAVGKNVLVHGAAGALGTLATQMLSSWGARVTAIARKSNSKVCLEVGAAEVVERTDDLFVSLSRSFDATLNFATWEDDLALIGCLRDGALGHATTVHPMLGNFDRLGWLRGMLRTLSQKKDHRRALPKGASNYAWVLFKPDKAALDDLRQFVEHNQVSLPIGLCKPLAAAGLAFDHVRKRQPGRVLLLP